MTDTSTFTTQPPKVNYWTGAHTFTLIAGIATMLFAPIVYGPLGLFIALAILAVLIVSPIQDKRRARKILTGEIPADPDKYWTRPRVTFAIVFVNLLLWTPWMFTFPVIIAGIVYLIVSGVQHSNRNRV